MAPATTAAAATKPTAEEQAANLTKAVTAASSGEVQTRPPESTFGQWLEVNKAEFAKVIPAQMKASGALDRLMRLALSAVNRNPDLLKCTVNSLAVATMDCLALGLEPNTAMKQAYLIPFKNNKTMTTEAQLIIGYQGLIDLHYRSERVLTMYARVFYEKDTFVYKYGTSEFLDHTESRERDRGAALGAYAYAKMQNGAYRFLVMYEDEINCNHRNRSAAYVNDPKNGPWITDTAAMWQKTVIRELSKWIPKSPDIQKAFEAEDASFEVVS
jgi:recombination protein RecT